MQERLEKSLQTLERVIYDTISRLEAENTSLRAEIIALKNDLKRAELQGIKQPFLDAGMVVGKTTGKSSKKIVTLGVANSEIASKDIARNDDSDEQAELKESLRKLKKMVN